MTQKTQQKSYPIEDALNAQKALRRLAGLGQEEFPVSAFIGMISDEIEVLRRQGYSDQDIAKVIRDNSPISLTAEDIAANYAPFEQRHPDHHA